MKWIISATVTAIKEELETLKPGQTRRAGTREYRKGGVHLLIDGEAKATMRLVQGRKRKSTAMKTEEMPQVASVELNRLERALWMTAAEEKRLRP